MKELLVGAAAAFVAVALLGCETPGPGEPLEPGIHMQDPPGEPAPPEQPMDQELPPMDEPMEEPMDQELPPLEEPVQEPMDPDEMPAPGDFDDLDDDDFGDPLEGFDEF